MPGVEEGSFSVGILGTGGGGGKGEDDVAVCRGDVASSGMEIEAFSLRCSILSL